MGLRLYHFKTPERSCAWVADPDAGFQFLGGKNEWWIWYGERWLCSAKRVTKEAGGGWMLWYPHTPKGYKGERCPIFPTLIQAAEAALELAGHKADKLRRKNTLELRGNPDIRTQPDMKITEGQKAILRTCDTDGLTNMKRIKKTNHAGSVASCVKRGWLMDSSEDHGKGCFALTHAGGDALRQVLGREPKYNS